MHDADFVHKSSHSRALCGSESFASDDQSAGSRHAEPSKHWAELSNLSSTMMGGRGMNLKAEKELLAVKALAKVRLSAKGWSPHERRTSSFHAAPIDCSAAASVFCPSALPSGASKRGSQGQRFSTCLATSGSDMHKFVDALDRTRCSLDKNSAHNPTELIPGSSISGANTGIREWDSMIDWKMMEHQDYETLPDDQFEKLSDKLHIKENWRRQLATYLASVSALATWRRFLSTVKSFSEDPVATIMTRVDYLQNDVGFGYPELRKLIDKEPKNSFATESPFSSPMSIPH